MSAHEEDSGLLCPRCGVTFDCHSVLSPTCKGDPVSEVKSITEEDGVHKQWYIDARAQSLATLPEFLRHLSYDYAHDYGTICHAIAAAGIAAMWAVERSPSGGITGFQSGCIMWEVIRAWGSFPEGPKRMVSYEDMLYPQYAHKFEKVISQNTWDWLIAEAKKHIAASPDTNVHSDVARHWQEKQRCASWPLR